MSERAPHTPFLKMHGLGNDFVIFDARRRTLDFDAGLVRRLASRRRGIGFDQMIVLRPSTRADAFMEIWNADGSEVAACGNATRCVGKLLIAEHGGDKATIETKAGLLSAVRADERISVNMGPARLDWQEIPLAHAADTLHIPYAMGMLDDPVAVNMGNPHVVFFVEDADAVPLGELGPQIETDPLFPERTNVSVASVKDGHIRLRVWERGAGITEACGTAACAATVAAFRRGLTDRHATVELDGGTLEIVWLPDGSVQMTGDAVLTYAGEVAL